MTFHFKIRHCSTHVTPAFFRVHEVLASHCLQDFCLHVFSREATAYAHPRQGWRLALSNASPRRRDPIHYGVTRLLRLTLESLESLECWWCSCWRHHLYLGAHEMVEVGPVSWRPQRWKNWVAGPGWRHWIHLRDASFSSWTCAESWHVRFFYIEVGGCHLAFCSVKQ